MTGRIITFYSYKGGVGRSMAVANIAVVLAQRGLRVLAVDWDLEAPGLDRYLIGFEMNRSGRGLLRLLLDAAAGMSPDYREYIWHVDDPEYRAFDFLQSGQDGDEQYARKVLEFDWRKFFAIQNGGNYIEQLRNLWRSQYDIVLIDSRTGLTDMGGVCTIQMPDIVVPMFTANHQSLFGVHAVMRYAQEARQRLGYDRMPLTVFPLPSRFGVRSEFRESQDWLDRFEDTLAEFYDDWLPKWARPRSVLEQVKIPQVDYFGFGEKLAVLEHGVRDPESMGFVYNRVADLLESDFSDIENWLGPRTLFQAQKEHRKRAHLTNNVSNLDRESYEFDLFVSYRRGPLISEWVRELLPLLMEWTEVKIGRPLRVFCDFSELQVGTHWPSIIEKALSRSRVMLAVLTEDYMKSNWCLAELNTFLLRSRNTGAELILPIVLSGGHNVPPSLTQLVKTDFSEFIFGKRALRDFRQHYDLQTQVQKLADTLASALISSPEFQIEWPVISPEQVSGAAAVKNKLIRVLPQRPNDLQSN